MIALGLPMSVLGLALPPSVLGVVAAVVVAAATPAPFPGALALGAVGLVIE